MDTKRLVSMMLVSFVIIFGWQILITRIYGPPHKPGDQTVTTAPATTEPSEQFATTQQATTTPDSIGTAPATGPATMHAPQMAQSPVHVVNPATRPSSVTIGDEKTFPMVVKLNSLGAGVDSVTLNEFRAPFGTGKYIFQTPIDPEDPLTRPMSTRNVTVNGTEVSLAGVNWTLEKLDAGSATFVVDLGLVKVRRIYQITPKDPNSKTKTFDLHVRYAIENTGPAKAKVSVYSNGVNTPPHENEQGRDLQTLGGYDKGYQAVDITHHFNEEYDAKKPTRDLTVGDNNAPLLWAGTASVYFNAIIRPEPLEPTEVSPKWISNVTATVANPDAKPTDRHVELTLQTTDLTVEPGKSLDLNSTIFLGPRWRAVLNEPAYSAFPLCYDQTLIVTSGMCGFCTFQFLINGLVGLLNFFHWIFGGFMGHGDWGLAIIALVVLVRSLLHPITKRSQVSMMRMGKMGPEVERLKKKYGDDKDELNRQMMAMYKDQGIGAYLGCLPMFLQMPIWIALWSALQSTFELRQAPFLWGWTWIHDLSQPDKLYDFGHTIALPLGLHFSAINLLPLLLGVVFYLQQEFTPKPPATTPEQETQQKMMKWMSLLFPVFLYNGPSGLNLYILTSTSIGIIESKRIRDHIKQKEAEEKAGKIFVDAPKSMKRKRDDDDGAGGLGAKRVTGPTPPKTGLAGWVQQLKDKADQLQREAQKPRGK
jgi:YidC/Oxa1 family membrane protein insertase